MTALMCFMFIIFSDEILIELNIYLEMYLHGFRISSNKKYLNILCITFDLRRSLDVFEQKKYFCSRLLQNYFFIINNNKFKTWFCKPRKI